jgi:hypothetical protein
MFILAYPDWQRSDNADSDVALDYRQRIVIVYDMDSDPGVK